MYWAGSLHRSRDSGFPTSQLCLSILLIFIMGSTCDPFGFLTQDACTSSERPGVLMLGTTLDLDGIGISDISGMSCDGSTIVGSLYFPDDPSDIFRTEAFRLTIDGEIEPIGFLGSTNINTSYALAVSADGRVIIGESSSPDGKQSFRWTRDGGFMTFDSPPDSDASIQTFDLSADGSVIVGRAVTRSSSVAFRWTETDGYHLFEVPSLENESYSRIYVSDDGRIIAGQVERGSRMRQVFRWTEETGAVLIDESADSNSSTWVQGISGDGSTIVGWMLRDGIIQPFRWTQEEGIVGLGRLPEEFGTGIPAVEPFISPGLNRPREDFGAARATSFDGSVVVGLADIGELHRIAFVWDAENGMRSVLSALSEEDAALLEGWSLISANLISADGRTIGGTGRNPNDNVVSWVVRLPD